jgi:hypothetical protein
VLDWQPRRDTLRSKGQRSIYIRSDRRSCILFTIVRGLELRRLALHRYIFMLYQFVVVGLGLACRVQLRIQFSASNWLLRKYIPAFRPRAFPHWMEITFFPLSSGFGFEFCAWNRTEVVAKASQRCHDPAFGGPIREQRTLDACQPAPRQC